MYPMPIVMSGPVNSRDCIIHEGIKYCEEIGKTSAELGLFLIAIALYLAFVFSVAEFLINRDVGISWVFFWVSLLPAILLGLFLIWH
jgi:hypothetical protein